MFCKGVLELSAVDEIPSKPDIATYSHSQTYSIVVAVVGAYVGDTVGLVVGSTVVAVVGEGLGSSVGVEVGSSDGVAVVGIGDGVGSVVGDTDGLRLNLKIHRNNSSSYTYFVQKMNSTNATQHVVGHQCILPPFC